MSKPSDDLSALFRSLRPDESVFQDNTNTVARDAEQRWPLFKAVAPEKPQETPALSAQERQRWVNQEKPEVGGRKPALSLPGLSDKMSKGLDRMSGRSVKNTAAVKPAMRRDPEKSVSERAVEQATERTRGARTPPVSPTNEPELRSSAAAEVVSTKSAASDSFGLGAFDKKPPVPTQATMVAGRNLPVPGSRSEDSLKSIFSRIEAKAEVVVKPSGNRSSFLDRLGKR